ncbi:MAG: helix-turn-helix transcriptional regulator [Thermoleophilaceae bacterium]
MELIADRVRLALVRHLIDHEHATLPELAKAAGVHVNTARVHVAALTDAGLFEASQRKPAGPGRPSVDYRLSEGWTLEDSHFLGLAELLAGVVTSGRFSDDQLRTVGSDWGRYLVGRPGAHEADKELARVLSHLGYDVRVEGDRVQLRGCPCPLVAPDSPHTVCLLGEGVVDGALKASGDPRRIRGASHDPGRRACHIDLVAPARNK